MINNVPAMFVSQMISPRGRIASVERGNWRSPCLIFSEVWNGKNLERQTSWEPPEEQGGIVQNRIWIFILIVIWCGMIYLEQDDFLEVTTRLWPWLVGGPFEGFNLMHNRGVKVMHKTKLCPSFEWIVFLLKSSHRNLLRSPSAESCLNVFLSQRKTKRKQPWFYKFVFFSLPLLNIKEICLF